MFSPEARIDDGKLDVVTASGLTRSNVVTELSRIHTGGHVNNPKVTIAQGSIARIETLLVQDAMPLEADGNVRGVTPVQFQVLPGGLRFILTTDKRRMPLFQINSASGALKKNKSGRSAVNPWSSNF